MPRSRLGVRFAWVNAAATLQLARIGWIMKSRQPHFFVSSAWMSTFAVLPMALAAIALVGPNARHIQPFVELAGTDNYMAYVTIGATAMIWSTSIGANVGLVLEAQRIQGTLGSIWLTPTSLLARVAGLGASGMSVGIARAVIAFAGCLGHPALPCQLCPIAVARRPRRVNDRRRAFGLVSAAVVLRARAGVVLVQALLVGTGILAGPAYPTTVLLTGPNSLANCFRRRG